MCPKTNPKSSPDSIGLVIRPEQFLSCKKQECHCVPGNNDPAAFTSHQICLSLFELWNRSDSQLHFQRASEKGRVTARCPCWLWSWLQDYLPFLVYAVTRAWSVFVHKLKAEWFAFDGTDTRTDIWIVLKEVKVVLFLQTGAAKNTLSKKFLNPLFLQAVQGELV